jgi:TetR/AcrR family transcriptional regulator
MENDTRTKLIEIATQLFAVKGFAAVPIREVTDGAHINVSAISYHFNGKEGLYQAVLEEQFAPMLQALQLAQSNSSLSPGEKLRLYADRIAFIHDQRPFFAHFMSSELAHSTECGGPIVEKYLSKVYDFLYATLQEGVANGDFQADLNLSYTTISLGAILNFYFISKPLLQKIINLSQQANAEYTANAFRIYLHGITNKAEK